MSANATQATQTSRGQVKWGRVVTAGIGAQLADDLIFAIVPFTGWAFGWIAPWLAVGFTGLFAAWIARTVPASAAIKHGALVGLIGGALAFLFGLPGWWALVYAAGTIAAGAFGGLAGIRTGSAPPATREPHSKYYA